MFASVLLALCASVTGADTMPSTAPATQPIDAPRVWAIGEGFRVDPISGRVREEWRIDGNPLPTSFDYPHQNFVWNADTRTISLAAARNEVVSYQLLVRGPARAVRVAHNNLRGPGRGEILAQRDMEILKQWYLNVTQNSSNRDSTTAGYNLGLGWYADALVPIGPSSRFYSEAFDIPDGQNDIPGQVWQGVWVDIYVPKTLQPGRYIGKVRVYNREFSEDLTVALEVYPVTLSDEFHCEVGLNNYGSIGRMGEGMRLKYHQMAHRHRMNVHEHYVAPETTGQGAQMRGVWDKYDEQMRPFLTGEAFTPQYGYRGPGEGKPVRWIYLPFEILGSHAWPLPKDQMRTLEYDAAVVAMQHDFVKHFQEKGWRDTRMMFFVNGLDEPTRDEAVQDIRYFGDLVQRAGEKQIYYRADINHLHDIGRIIEGWTEQKMLDILAPVIDLWCCVADFKRTDFAVLQEVARRRPHTQLWFYQNREPSVGGYTLDDETIGLRTWPVIAWKYGLDGCILWEVSFGGQSKDPWVDPRNSVYSDRGVVHNLAGFVIYPPREGMKGPAASIRLKSFGRGAQDYEYLRLLSEVAGREAAEKILEPVLRHALHRPGREYGAAGDWSHNPEDWERMRVQVLEQIVEARRTTRLGSSVQSSEQ